jgi:hypothetical protein
VKSLSHCQLIFIPFGSLLAARIKYDGYHGWHAWRTFSH